MRKKHDRAIATALIVGYSSVFVIHPAILGILFGSVLSPGRALADESERIYQQIQNTYKTPPESVASENKLQEIQNKYSDNAKSSDNTESKSLSDKINSYATSNSSASPDLSKYDPVDFSSAYQSTYAEAAGGGIGINKLQQPGVSGSNISINYSSSGTATLSRDSNGKIISTETSSATTHTMDSNQLVSNEGSASDAKFKAGSDYNPSNEESLIYHTKERVQDSISGAKTSDAVSYRTINNIRMNNYPQAISRNDQIFTSAKNATKEAITSTGDWSASCTKGTTYSTKTTHYGVLRPIHR